MTCTTINYLTHTCPGCNNKTLVDLTECEDLTVLNDSCGELEFPEELAADDWLWCNTCETIKDQHLIGL